MTVADQVTKLVQDQTGLGAEVTPEASFFDDLGCDSLDHVEIILALEEAFNIEISDDDADRLQRVKDAINYVEARK